MSHSVQSDTIVALSTPHGESAIAAIRLSGPDCPTLARTALKAKTIVPRKAIHGYYYAVSGQVLDDLVYINYAEDASYTGESMLELFAHGNPYIIQNILEDLIHRGCRLAEPGEFTRTAFLNGRMDLSQAEAVIDLIRARSDKVLEIARRQLDGSLGNAVRDLCDRLLHVIAGAEAYIDFPEEDLPPEDTEGPTRSLSQIVTDVSQLISTQHYGDLLREGVRTVIAGLPNAGKSSLLNYLCGSDRVIVSPQPGTTRDYVEETVLIGPYKLRIIDTAGLHETDSDIERQGIDKTLQQLAKADIILLLVDQTAPYPTFPPSIQDLLPPAKTILLLNKIDLDQSANTVSLETIHHKHCRISAKTGEGMHQLRQLLQDHIASAVPAPEDSSIVVSARHADALQRAKESISQAIAGMRAQSPAELVASDLREALDALGEITGKIDNEAMLDKLFSSFCIGK